MSDSHSTAPHDDGPHEGPIKTPKQLIIAVVASFVVPIVAIILLVNYVDFGAKPSAGSDGLGATHHHRLRGAAELGAEGQGRHGRAGRRCIFRLRDRPRRGLHGQSGRRQARRAASAGASRERAELSVQAGLRPAVFEAAPGAAFSCGRST